MNFNKILKQWESGKKPEKQFKKSMDRWLDQNEIENKDQNIIKDSKTKNINHKNIKIDDELDLHGLKVDEAEKACINFISESYKSGFKKILVIHGKGLHSKSEPILKRMVLSLFKSSSLIEKYGEADKKNGGKGASWALLCYRSR